MTWLAQISDLHIQAPGARIGGRVDTTAYLERCIERLVALAPRPDAVIVTGDLVDRGAIEEYEVLRARLARLPMPVHLLLGNHDARAAFRAVFHEPPYTSGEFVQYAADAGTLRLLALDTNDPESRTGGGVLCRARRDWLAAQLEDARGRDVVIAMHHPPFTTGLAAMDAACLDPGDAAELAAIVARHPNVQRVICGHLHRPIHARFAGTIASTAPSCAHQVEPAFDPAAPAAFTLEPPALALHARTASGLVSHHLYVDRFEGPYPF